MIARRLVWPPLALLLSLLWIGTFVRPIESGPRGKKPACAADLNSCSPRGCADVDNPDDRQQREADALVNMLKRTPAPQGVTPTRLTFQDFEKLQQLADERVGQDRSLTAEDRGRLRNLPLSATKSVSEGDLVELRGFVVMDSPRPKPSGPESVNCRLPGAENNDIHIPIVETSQDEEFSAMVVEMIPQGRPTAWNSKPLKRAARDERPVIIRGHLFYDNKHQVNGDSERDNGQPKRFTLWEIHPVSEFWVCVRADRKCGETLAKPKDWKRLEDF